ncbi:branched-chain amino acid ABC transporter substrate-binding protein [Alloalcanivorax marinus]|uniref:branched-chain amino acid ABC transporter substrate-binding protein n=1 Tax=Alloalcanivorax marinus TaxID=1177169 RepID=UPI001EF8030A|nr:branched-chain amino acid ABC transporter substrate-binding protein [Alloalcanivorax marinus]
MFAKKMLCNATAAVLCFSFLFSATTQAAPADKEPVTIAIIDPLTGPMAGVGLPLVAHMKFEAERLNAEGGMNGHPFRIVGLDNKVSPQESLVQLQKAADDGIRYIVQGNGSSVGSALISAIDKHNRRNPGEEMLYLNHGAVDPVLTNERCSFWHFRFDAGSDMKMNALTNWIQGQKDIKKVYLINQDYSFGHSVSQMARDMLKEKRPDIEIVGNDFHPLAKVKDFTPYATKIKASGADAIISGNWGQDMVLLAKTLADFGVDAPFLTYYAGSPGTVTQVGERGVDHIYQIYAYYGDTEDPEIGQRQKDMYEQTDWDYFLFYPRLTTMMEMLKKAADQVQSVDPVKIAFAMEGLSVDMDTGTYTMRKEDHQVQQPMVLSVMKGDMPYGAEGTDYNFAKVALIPAAEVAMPTTCRMRRPRRD